MSNDREQEIRLHHQKWKKWKMQMKNQDQKLNKQNQKPMQSAHYYAAKIIGKLQQPQKKSCPISNKFEKQFESNACSVCYQLMIPPRNPITLFPCAHNMCKICLFKDGDQKQKSYTLKINKCYLCNQSISNYAENRSLMSLICTYTDNKHLIQKQDIDQQEEIQQTLDSQLIARLRLRCDILQKEKKSISNALVKQRKDKKVLDEVLEKLVKQKKKNNEEVSALQKQAKLIQEFLTEKREQLQKIKSKISNAEEKKRVVQKTLEPLKTQKEKMQILEAAKLIDR